MDKSKRKKRDRYCRKVRQLTLAVDRNQISGYDSEKLLVVTRSNFGELRTSDLLVMDHIISVSYGFKHNIPEEMISHITNLRYISSKKNSLKGSKCFVDDSNCWIIIEML